jgi:chromosome segregation ATPase
MATNGTEIAAELRLDEEVFRIPRTEQMQAAGSLDRTQIRKRSLEHQAPDPENLRSAGGMEAEGFALAPLVNKIAYGFAKGLVVAIKELEDHIANETRKVGETVDRRLDALQTTLEDLSNFTVAQRSTNAAVEGHLQELTAGLRQIDAREAADIETLRSEARDLSASISRRIDASGTSLQESETRQTANVERLRTDTKELWNAVSQRIDGTVAAQAECNARQSAALETLENQAKTFSQSISDKVDGIFGELGVHQEDIAAIKATLSTFSTRVEGLVERLDRQADTVRSMCSAYSQRETELEQLVNGLTRLRSFSTPLPTNGL